jgi:hypothetical protein
MSEFEIKLLEVLAEINRELHDIKKIQEFNVKPFGYDVEVISHSENHD